LASAADPVNRRREDDSVVLFRQLIRQDTGCCTYLIGSKSRREFLLVDPLMDIERFIEQTKKFDGRIAAVIDTHVHADHLSGAREIQRATNAPIMMHESSAVRFPFTKLSEGNHNLAGVNVSVIHTPGHAPEHICLLLENRAVLTGDTLLVGDVGRSDLGRGDPDSLYDALHAKLLKLDNGIKVFPAHVGKKHFISGDLNSTIGIERRKNLALRVQSKAEFKEYMSEGWPPKPTNYELFVKVNSGELSLDEAQDLALSLQGKLFT
jgi:glyoxylase-like metal-dependent hydrolase (beta-lactamase superfamily II)